MVPVAGQRLRRAVWISSFPPGSNERARVWFWTLWKSLRHSSRNHGLHFHHSMFLERYCYILIIVVHSHKIMLLVEHGRCDSLQSDFITEFVWRAGDCSTWRRGCIWNFDGCKESGEQLCADKMPCSDLLNVRISLSVAFDVIDLYLLSIPSALACLPMPRLKFYCLTVTVFFFGLYGWHSWEGQISFGLKFQWMASTHSNIIIKVWLPAIMNIIISVWSAFALTIIDHCFHL